MNIAAPTAADLAVREDYLRKQIEVEKSGPRLRLLRHELREVVSERMAAEKGERG
jgi:hypothetical protein